MWVASNWKDYEILDTGGGRKLERWGKYILDRPDPQVIWKERLHPKLWEKADGTYHRNAKGGGEWEIRSLPEDWQIEYTLGENTLRFNLKPFSFKHTGLFPEQAANWEWMYGLIKKQISEGKEVNVLNLFAYTGGATLACAAAGAKVTHLDASKGMVNWARENSISSGLEDRPVRWLFDDCSKFVQREIRRGNHYDAIIMDPPSYGRGPKGEIWQMEEMIFEFIGDCKSLLANSPLFFLLNSYTTGLAPSTISYMLKLHFPGSEVLSEEVGLTVDADKKLYLPCGASGRVIF